MPEVDEISMSTPIDLPGRQSSIYIPSAIFSLERHESFPHERFAYNVLRIGIRVLHRKNLHEQIQIAFPQPTASAPAWLINASIELVRDSGNSNSGFKLTFPELLPTLALVFIHTVFEHRDISTNPTEAQLKLLGGDIQRFLDLANSGIAAYRDHGTASAIRRIHTDAGITMTRLQEIVNDFDSASQFIANHEIAHAYVGQLSLAKKLPQHQSKAYEFVADLVATSWLFERFVLLTPDTDEYRHDNDTTSHIESLCRNVRWLILTQQRIALLMSIAAAQATGQMSLGGGSKHPTGIGRYQLQTLWLARLIEGYLSAHIGEQLVQQLSDEATTATLTVAALVTRQEDFDEMLGDEEAEALHEAAKLADELKVEELHDSAQILRIMAQSKNRLQTKVHTMATPSQNDACQLMKTAPSNQNHPTTPGQAQDDSEGP